MDNGMNRWLRLLTMLMVTLAVVSCANKPSANKPRRVFVVSDFNCSGSIGFFEDTVSATNSSGQVLTNIRGQFIVTGIPRFNPEPEVSHSVAISWPEWRIGETKAIEFAGFASARMHDIRLQFTSDQGAVDFHYRP